VFCNEERVRLDSVSSETGYTRNEERVRRSQQSRKLAIPRLACRNFFH